MYDAIAEMISKSFTALMRARAPHDAASEDLMSSMS